MSSEIDRPVTRPQDLDDLNILLRALRGQMCWAVRWSYGDELRLDFGGQRPYRNPLLAGKCKGEWVLGTRATPWLLSGPGAELSGADEPTLAGVSSAVVGARVVAARAAYPDLDLQVDFDNGYTLSLRVDTEESSLAAWELFTPDDMVVTVGPGPRWTYTRADSASTGS